MAVDLDITIGPTKLGPASYLGLVSPIGAGGEYYQLSFQAEFTNKGPVEVTVTRLEVSFPAASGLATTKIAIRRYVTDGTLSGLPIPPGQTRRPVDFVATDNIILGAKPPASITFSAFTALDAEPARRTVSLLRHTTPVPGGYSWFSDASDLDRGEYWQSVGAVHCCGPQLYALDLGVMKFQGGVWTDVLPGTAGDKNEHFRTYGKPIRAMADGKVLSFDNTKPDNPVIGTPAPENGYGSHFIIRHGDEDMVYAHLQPASLNSALTAAGSAVAKGQLLGLAGNSGNSYKPHLHIHAVDRVHQMLRPIPWRDKQVAVPGGAAAGPSAWRRSQNQGLAPNVDTFVYPGPVPPADDSEWSSWVPRGGVLRSGPTVASWAPHRLDVFVRGMDDGLYHLWWNGSAWGGWESLGGVLTSKPAAVSWGPNRIDVFARGLDNALWHRWWNGSKWLGWESLGGVLTSGPAVCSRGLNRLDVFVAGADGGLYQKLWNGSKWSDWIPLGGVISSDPAAVSWAKDRIDVMARGMDDDLWHLWWHGGAWSGWQSHGKAMIHGPAISSRKANRLDVFVVAPDGALHHRLWTGSAWTGWEGLGGRLTADPGAVSWSSNRIDVFARGTDDGLYQTRWEP